MTFSKRTMDSIHACLTNSGITQRELAAEMDCTEAWVSMILKPGFNTTLKTIDRIEAALHQILLKRTKFDIIPVAEVGPSLLRKPSAAAPAGCHCTDRCMAPRIMGRQQPCRRPGGIPGGPAPKSNPHLLRAGSVAELKRAIDHLHEDNPEGSFRDVPLILTADGRSKRENYRGVTIRSWDCQGQMRYDAAVEWLDGRAQGQ